MKVISFLNQKGGVGKSTTVSTLMAYLKNKGYRVLGIDTDAQGHLSKLCGAITEDENTILELFQNRATFDETVQSSPFGDIVPADYNLQLAVLQFANMPDFMFSMADILEKVEGRYDFVLIDCPPAVSVVTTATLVASNYVAIPTEAEYLSLDGVRELAKTVNVARNRLNKNLKVLGLFVVKYNPRRKLTKELEALFSRSAQDIFGAELIPVKIRQTVDIPMAQALKKSIFEYKPQSAVAKEYAELGEYILRRV